MDRMIRALLTAPRPTLEVTGPHGSALVKLEGAGKLDLQDLLKHHSLILPPH